MSGYLFSKWSLEEGNAPNYFHDTHIIMMIRNSCKTDHARAHVDTQASNFMAM